MSVLFAAMFNRDYCLISHIHNIIKSRAAQVGPTDQSWPAIRFDSACYVSSFFPPKLNARHYNINHCLCIFL